MDMVTGKSDNDFGVRYFTGMADLIKSGRFNLSEFTSNLFEYSTEITISFSLTMTASPEEVIAAKEALERDIEKWAKLRAERSAGLSDAGKND